MDLLLLLPNRRLRSLNARNFLQLCYRALWHSPSRMLAWQFSAMKTIIKRRLLPVQYHLHYRLDSFHLQPLHRAKPSMALVL